MKKKNRYALGVVQGETHEELGLNVVAHCGLSSRSEDNKKYIGQRCVFTNPKSPYERQGTFVVVGTQRMWGYDETGRYRPDIEGVRVSHEGDFGCPAEIKDLTFES